MLSVQLYAYAGWRGDNGWENPGPVAIADGVAQDMILNKLRHCVESMLPLQSRFLTTKNLISSLQITGLAHHNTFKYNNVTMQV